MKLSEEFKELKAELFDGYMIAEQRPDQEDKWNRYQLLLGYFKKAFRHSKWEMPSVTETHGNIIINLN